MRCLTIFVYDDGKEIEEIGIAVSNTYVFYSDIHPEMAMFSKEEVLKEIELRL